MDGHEGAKHPHPNTYCSKKEKKKKEKKDLPFGAEAAFTCVHSSKRSFVRSQITDANSQPPFKFSPNMRSVVEVMDVTFWGFCSPNPCNYVFRHSGSHVRLCAWMHHTCGVLCFLFACLLNGLYCVPVEVVENPPYLSCVFHLQIQILNVVAGWGEGKKKNNDGEVPRSPLLYQ